MPAKIALFFLLGLMATPAQAYIGPGMGAGVIASVIGIVVSVFLALFVVLYYPIKRALRKRKNKTSTHSGGAGEPKDP